MIEAVDSFINLCYLLSTLTAFYETLFLSESYVSSSELGLAKYNRGTENKEELKLVIWLLNISKEDDGTRCKNSGFMMATDGQGDTWSEISVLPNS